MHCHLNNHTLYHVNISHINTRKRKMDFTTEFVNNTNTKIRFKTWTKNCTKRYPENYKRPAFTWPKVSRPNTSRRLCFRAFGIRPSEPRQHLRLPRIETYGPARVWRMRARPLRSPASVAHADFLKVGHFAPFSQFLHIKVEIFRMFFSVHVCLWPLWTIKSFMEIGPHVFEKSGMQTHRQTDKNRQTRQLYIYIYI